MDKSKKENMYLPPIKSKTLTLDMSTMSNQQKERLFMGFIAGISYKDWQSLRNFAEFEFHKRLAINSISTQDLIKELESRKEIMIYACGPYRKYEAQIKRKYTQDRGLEELPNNYKLILITE